MRYLVTNLNAAEALASFVSDSLVRLYKPFGSVTIAQKEVSLVDVRWGVRLLSNCRLNDSHDLVMRLVSSKVQIFPFYFHVNVSGSCHAIVPPILESYRTAEGEQRYLLLDGSHRCYAALPSFTKISGLTVTFVSNPRPLPCNPLKASEICVVESQPHLKDLFIGLAEQEFRPVRQLTHKAFRFESLGEALTAMNLSSSALSQLE